ncbi:MAG: hypothetical protein J2P19_03820 [Pseudonocardia sp.]|nr:hypothetical protein [Pseudonocardia sp.]
MTADVVRIAMEQVSPTPGDLPANRELVGGQARQALRDGADIVVFPELVSSGYVVAPELVEACAEPVDGPFVSSLVDVTSGSGGLIAAGLCEREGDAFFNSVAVVGPNGPVLTYRKLHLFDAEKNVFTPGGDLPLLETEYGVLGVCICYDLRFVEVLRLLSLRGCDLVLAPAAWVSGFDAAVPRTGLTRQAESVIVQANLDQVAVVAVSQVSGGGVGTALGGSLAVDAYGTVIGGPLSRERPDRAAVEIDIAKGRAALVRSELIAPRADRRRDVYALRYGGDEL